MSKNDKKGAFFEITRGRKVKPGTVGVCFWNDVKHNPYKDIDEDKVGLLVIDAVDGGPDEGDKVFVKADYVTAVEVPDDLRAKANALLEMDRQRFEAERGKRPHTSRFPAAEQQSLDVRSTRYPQAAV